MPAKNSQRRTTATVLLASQSKSQLDDLLAAKRTWSARLLKAPRPIGFRAFAAAPTPEPDQNVQGVGIGEKIEAGKPTGVLAIKFFVRRKYAENELSSKEELPKSINGLPVDVEEVGLFRAFAAAKTKPAGRRPNPKARIRPAQPGCSIGFQFPPPQNEVMAGTFGAVVKDSSGTYVLSNNHVLANEDRLPTGAPIFQPGLLDGGNPAKDKIAELAHAIKLQASGFNQVDCAMAKAITPTVLARDILYIGPPAGGAQAAIDMRVHKFGRTTSYTVGHVTSIATDVTVGYETGNYSFENQIIVVGDHGPFSAAGDSGSLILDRQTNNAVGLLFAGSTSHTIANHIADVLKALDVTLA